MVSPELGHGAGQVGPVAATAAALSQPGAALGHKLKSFHLEKALVFLDWTTSSWWRPPTLSNEGTAATGRCRRACTGYGGGNG